MEEGNIVTISQGRYVGYYTIVLRKSEEAVGKILLQYLKKVIGPSSSRTRKSISVWWYEKIPRDFDTRLTNEIDIVKDVYEEDGKYYFF